jgi:hypothetical protein
MITAITVQVYLIFKMPWELPDKNAREYDYFTQHRFVYVPLKFGRLLSHPVYLHCHYTKNRSANI